MDLKLSSPLVSVIIPNYNHASFLEERILSVLNQTYKNYEIIILDDCSTDNSREIIEKYRSNLYVSHVVYNEYNSGSPFKQWHKGFELAQGKYIWIAESDDSCSPKMLEFLVKEFQEGNANLVLAFCNSYIVDERGNKICRVVPSKLYGFHGSGKSFISNWMCIKNRIPNASAVLFNKDIAMSVNNQYMSYKASGDWLFWIEMCEYGDIAVVKYPLNYFRSHSGKVTNIAESMGIQQKENKMIFNYLNSKSFFSSSKRKKAKREALYSCYYPLTHVQKSIKMEAIAAWSPSNSDIFYIRFMHIMRSAVSITKKNVKSLLRHL